MSNQQKTENLAGAGKKESLRVALTGMTGITMTQFVRRNGKTEFPAGDFDRTLEVGLVHVVADQDGHSPEQSVSLGKCGGVSDACRAFCAQGINTLNGLVQDVLVKEKDGVESLILGTGSDVVVTGQAGEEEFDLLAAGKGRGHVGWTNAVQPAEKFWFQYATGRCIFEGGLVDNEEVTTAGLPSGSEKIYEPAVV